MITKSKKMFLAITCLLSAHVFVLIGSSSSVVALPADQSQNLHGEKQQGSVVAYYFHGNYRCTSCKKIEQLTRKTIDNYFPNQLKNGTLTYKAINTDQPENKHFIQDYQLYTKSVVIVLMQNGKQVKWKNLEKVWQLLDNEDSFLNYVKSELENYFKEL